MPSRAFLGITNTVDIGLNLTGEWDRRRIGEVLAQIRNAIELQPTLPIAYVALSQALSPGAGDLDAALAAAQQACRLSPNDAECFYILGAAQLQIGQIEIALGNLEQAMNRNPSPPAYLPAFHATAPWANRRFDEAIRVADDCLTRAPDFWRCHQDRIVRALERARASARGAQRGDSAPSQGAAYDKRIVRPTFGTAARGLSQSGGLRQRGQLASRTRPQLRHEGLDPISARSASLAEPMLSDCSG